MRRYLQVVNLSSPEGTDLGKSALLSPSGSSAARGAVLDLRAPSGGVIPDSPDGSGQQPRRPRKRWPSRQFLLSPVASVRIRLPGSLQEADLAAEIGARSWRNANPSGESGVIPTLRSSDGCGQPGIT